MIRLTCPLDRCATLEFPDDAEPTELAQAMVDHLERDGFFGDQLIDRLAAARVTREHSADGVLVRQIDRPLLAEDGTGRRHAIQPGPISVDGRGAAACSGTRTVRIVNGLDGRPLRATDRKEPGAAQPQCVACRRRL